MALEDLYFYDYADAWGGGGTPFMDGGWDFPIQDSYAWDLDTIGPSTNLDGVSTGDLYPSGTYYTGADALRGDYAVDQFGAPRTPATGDFSETPSGTAFSGRTSTMGLPQMARLAEQLLRGGARTLGETGGGSVSFPRIESPASERIGAVPVPPMREPAAMPAFNPMAMPTPAAREEPDIRGLMRLLREMR